MDKKFLLDICNDLGIVADESMTIQAIKALIEAKRSELRGTNADQSLVTPVAPQLSLTKKQSSIKGFNYTRDYVRLVFANGDTAILGSKDSPTITTALALKGQSVEYRLGDKVVTEHGSYHKVFIDCIG